MTVAAILLVGGAVVPAAVGTAGATTAAQSGRAYAGTNVSFDTSSNAVVDYAVGGETMFRSMRVQSKSAAGSGGSLSGGVDASVASNVAGSSVSVDSKTETGARLKTGSGATIRAHDDGRGVLVVEPGGKSQVVSIDVSRSSRAESAGENRVVVTTDGGATGTFIAVGNGSVSVADDGNVTAAVGSGGRLVFRSYPGGRSAADRRDEKLIAGGDVAAEVYATGNGSGDAAADVVRYDSNTTVKTTGRSADSVTMTADSSTHHGAVILTTVPKSVVASASDARVTVDGHAAARASSESELRSATDGGDTSKFLVQGSGSANARANTEVAVALNHFSKHEITVRSAGESGGGSTTSTAAGGSSTTSGGSGGSTAGSGTGGSTAGGGDGGSTAANGGETTSSTLPGFGFGAALLALALSTIAAVRRGR
ncbi:MAG: PGF-CTERM sorting domain-containing protein [Salinigranum sp.]